MPRISASNGKRQAFRTRSCGPYLKLLNRAAHLGENMAQAPSAPSQPTGVRWLIFGLACAASWLLYLHRYAWGIVKPYYKQENPEISDYQLGWLDSAFNATYAVGQIPCGMAGDRFGTRSTLSLFTLLWSLAVGGVALTHGFWRLIVARAAFGLAQAVPTLPSSRLRTPGFRCRSAPRCKGWCQPWAVSGRRSRRSSLPPS